MKFDKCIAIIAAVSIWFYPAIAFAEGSIEFDMIRDMSLRTQLEKELNAALSGTGQTPSDVVCTAARLGRRFGELSAARIAPFECRVGDRTSIIEAENIVRLQDGQYIPFEAIDDFQNLPVNALLYRIESWRWEDSN